MTEFCFDFGNARWKFYDPRRSDFDDVRHAIYPLTETQWQQASRTGLPTTGFVKVNDMPYAIGDAARRYVNEDAKPKGASRYKPTYYGVGLAYALAACYQSNNRNIRLIATHAPADIAYAGILRTAASGKWQVQSEWGDFEFVVHDVFTLDEPLGGFSHFAFTEDGRINKKFNTDQTLLIIDIGGFTTDVAAIDAGGNIDTGSLKSSQTVGTIRMLDRFETDMRSNNALMFQDATKIDIRRIEAALLSGKYPMQKTAIDCRREASEAKALLVNDVVDLINASGGVANFDAFILTGGGAVLIYDELCHAMPRANFIKSEPKPERARFSNVFGAHKLWNVVKKANK